MAFDVASFVAECRSVRSRPDWPQAIAGILERVIAHPHEIDACIEARGYQKKKGFDIFLQSEDLTIYPVNGEPGRLGPPHDHATVAIVAVYRGTEGYRTFRDEAGKLVEAGRLRVSAPDVSILGSDLIHAFDNTQTEGSGSLHVYGNSHFDSTQRRLWNPHTLEQQPFRIDTQVAWRKELTAAARQELESKS